jgi:hypothetical protein
VDTTDSRLSDAREWSAETATQAEAEAGTGTNRRAFTPQRVFQAIAAWWQSVSTATGRAVVGAVDPEAARSAIGAGTSSLISSTSGSGGAVVITNLMTLTKAEYDAIASPSASTLYVIVG